MASPVLTLPPGQPSRFDGESLGGVWVEPPADDADGPWRMIYHGRGEKSDPDVVKLSMGAIGAAESDDGITWRRVDGPGDGGAFLAPARGDGGAFDAALVGMGSVAGDRLYYFGGSREPVDIGGRTMLGVRQTIGLIEHAMVEGGGLSGDLHTQERRQVLVGGPAGEWDSVFAASPQVLRHAPGDWRMYYHGAGAPDRRFRIGLAVSGDGVNWERKGVILEPGEEGAWDDGGCSRRHVFPHNGGYAMLYEASSAGGQHGIGLALSGDGLAWRRARASPVFEPPGEAGAWDERTVSAPHFVPSSGGGGRLYYVGISAAGEPAVGVARSEPGAPWSFRRW